MVAADGGPRDEPALIDLGSIDEGMLDLVGGKAVNLGRMLAAGTVHRD